MLQITKGEVWSVLNVLREIRDGAETEDISEDIDETIEFLEAILDNDTT